MGNPEGGTLEGDTQDSFQKITKISQDGENNDILDIAESKISSDAGLYEQSQSKLAGLRAQYETSGNIDVTKNEIDQLMYMLEKAMNHSSVERRLDLIVTVLQDFISHQEREQNVVKKKSPAQIKSFVEKASPILENAKMGRLHDAWVEGESSFVFVLIPQLHQHPGDSLMQRADEEIQRIQHKEIFPLLGALAKYNICNIVANEGHILARGPVSKERILNGLDILAEPDDGAFLAELEFPEIDLFGVEKRGFDTDEMLIPLLAYHILTTSFADFYKTDEGKAETERLWEDTTIMSNEDFLKILGITGKDKKKVEKFFSVRKLESTMTFREYMMFLHKLADEDIVGQFDKKTLVERNPDIVKNLSQVQENTNSHCVSLVMGVGHFKDLSEMGGESIQRILRRKGISYVTLAPYSVDMSDYDFVEEQK